MHTRVPSIIAIIILVCVGAGWYWYGTRTEDTSPREVMPVATSTPSATTTKTNTPTDDLVAMATEALLGTWQDSSNPKVLREFKAGNVLIDTRDQNVTRGSWRAFLGEDAGNVSFETKPGHIYLTITESGETSYVKVTNLTLDQLQLVYMDRAGMLFYSRIK